jgi:transposase
MLSMTQKSRIFLAFEPADMRKGIDGLGALVKQYGEDIFGGHLFVFLSKSRDRVKILTFERGGFVVYYKRLEKGRFSLPQATAEQATIALDAAQLHMLLDGIDLNRVQRPKLWTPPGVKKIDTRSDL